MRCTHLLAFLAVSVAVSEAVVFAARLQKADSASHGILPKKLWWEYYGSPQTAHHISGSEDLPPKKLWWDYYGSPEKAEEAAVPERIPPNKLWWSHGGSAGTADNAVNVGERWADSPHASPQ